MRALVSKHRVTATATYPAAETAHRAKGWTLPSEPGMRARGVRAATLGARLRPAGRGSMWRLSFCFSSLLSVSWAAGELRACPASQPSQAARQGTKQHADPDLTVNNVVLFHVRRPFWRTLGFQLGRTTHRGSGEHTQRCTCTHPSVGNNAPAEAWRWCSERRQRASRHLEGCRPSYWRSSPWLATAPADRACPAP